MTAEERHEVVVSMTKAGASAREIAEVLGVSRRTVQRIRRAHGVGGQAARPFTAEELERARALLEDGISYREVACTLRRNRDSLARALPGYGLSPSEAGAIGHLNRRYRWLLEGV